MNSNRTKSKKRKKLTTTTKKKTFEENIQIKNVNCRGVFCSIIMMAECNVNYGNYVCVVFFSELNVWDNDINDDIEKEDEDSDGIPLDNAFILNRIRNMRRGKLALSFEPKAALSCSFCLLIFTPRLPYYTSCL